MTDHALHARAERLADWLEHGYAGLGTAPLEVATAAAGILAVRMSRAGGPEAAVPPDLREIMGAAIRRERARLDAARPEAPRG